MKNRRKDNKGNGIGAHQEVSPMARGTRTKNKRDRQDRRDRKAKQRGWS